MRIASDDTGCATRKSKKQNDPLMTRGYLGAQPLRRIFWYLFWAGPKKVLARRRNLPQKDRQKNKQHKANNTKQTTSLAYDPTEYIMSLSPIPQIVATDIFAVTPEWLLRKGVTLLLLDLDNTLISYAKSLPSERVLTWMNSLKQAGVELYLISNNRSSDRVRAYAQACDIPYVAQAGKPSPRTLRAAMAERGKTPAETALMGDQIFTDVLAANRAGALSILVKPLKMGALFRLRYIAEQPLRACGREKLR